MATPGGGTSHQQSGIDEAWQAAQRLLDAGAYERVVEVLYAAHAAIEQTDDGVWADTLSAAVQICRACSQSRAEVTWHRTACEAADQREQELRQQLSALLDLIGASRATDGREKQAPPAGSLPAIETHPLERSAPKSVQRPGLWRRVQRLLGWGNGLWPAEQQSPAGSVEQPPPPVAPEAERPRTALRMPQGGSTEVIRVPEAAQAPPSLVVHCLGPFRVYQDDQPVEHWPSSKGKAILKYLVTHRERPVAKEVLMESFWPDAHPDAARNNLNVAIYGLREALRRSRPTFSHVLFQNDFYMLNPELRIWVDYEAFAEHLACGQMLEQEREIAAAISEYRAAEALYQGEFLEEDRYEDWLMPRRQRLCDDYLSLLGRLSRYYFDQEDDIACTTVCRKMLAVDRCREEAHRRLMRCYCRQGQLHLALRQYHLCVEALKDELDLPPTEKTVALYGRIRESK